MIISDNFSDIESNIDETVKAIKEKRLDEALEFAEFVSENMAKLQKEFDELIEKNMEKDSEISDLEGQMEDMIEPRYFETIITDIGTIDYITPAQIVHQSIMDTLGEKLNKVGHNEIQRILDAI